MYFCKPYDVFICMISKRKVHFGETCPYENKTVTELNIEVNYKGDME